MLSDSKKKYPGSYLANIDFNVAFVDWLDVTFPSDLMSVDRLVSLCEDYQFAPLTDRAERGGKRITLVGPLDCKIQIGTYPTVIRLSLSGQALGYIRSVPGMYFDLIDFLSTEPHHITRMDVAYDTPEYTPNVFNRYKRKYSQSCKIGRKSQPTKWVLERPYKNSAKHETGTFYVGHRKSSSTTVMARVYDKKLHLHQQIVNLPPSFSDVTRYEITVKGFRDRASPCLSDLYDPTSLFWHYASPSLIRAPSEIPAWSPTNDFQFKPKSVSRKLPSEVIDNLLANSRDVQILFRLFSQMDEIQLPHFSRKLSEAYEAFSKDRPSDGLNLEFIINSRAVEEDRSNDDLRST